MIQVRDLISKFRYALDNHWGYIYGKCELWSEAKQKAYEREYAGDPDRRNSCLYGGKWAGHYVTDCARLFNWAFGQLGGIIARGSNSIWDRYCAAKGNMHNGLRLDGKPLLPGTAVFTTSGNKHNHIGLYIGDGTVIEAQGAQAGVVTSSIKNKKWTAWAELKGVDYGSDGEEAKEMEATVVLPAGKSGSTVNMRKEASIGSDLITRVPVGEKVLVFSDQGQWCKIGYKGYTGWMQSNYLEYDGQGDESSDDAIDQDTIDQIHAKLNEMIQAYNEAGKTIAQAAEEIGTLIGRG